MSSRSAKASTSVGLLIDRVRKSRLINPVLLDALAGVHGDQPISDCPNGFLFALVEQKLLTRFQAERISKGQYKGFRLGSYTILDQLGSGGSGQVFLAIHNEMHRHVAIKVVKIHEENEEHHVRLLREARTAAMLDHPNIVRIFDLKRDRGFPYIVMEYIDGVSLEVLAANKKPLPVAAAADYVRQTALGLQHAHLAGLVHRDIKPGNLLVDRQGHVHITDFGLVREIQDTETCLTAQYGNAGALLGTVDYIAPEQTINSSDVDIRADIYSLGATLYFLLCGRTLFPEGRLVEKLLWQQSRVPQPISEIRNDLPQGLIDVVNKAIAKNRADRYQEPAELAQALTPYCQGLVPLGEDITKSNRLSRPTKPILQEIGPAVQQEHADPFSDFWTDHSEPELASPNRGSTKTNIRPVSVVPQGTHTPRQHRQVQSRQTIVRKRSNISILQIVIAVFLGMTGAIIVMNLVLKVLLG